MSLFLDQLNGLRDGYVLSKLPDIPDIAFWLALVCVCVCVSIINYVCICTYVCEGACVRVCVYLSTGVILSQVLSNLTKFLFYIYIYI